MRGLLIKDFKLMKNQIRFFISVFGIAIIMSLAMKDNSFILGYITFVIPVFALNTIGYDELDNGQAFLFTLPFSRKTYVYEKYCFGLMLGIVSFVAAVLLSVVFGMLNGTVILESLLAAPFMLGFVVVMLSVLIPIQLKFGVDNSRIALIAFFGLIGALGFGVVQLLKHLGIDVLPLIRTLTELNFGVLTAVTAVIAAAVLLLSMRISVAMINKKEY